MTVPGTHPAAPEVALVPLRPLSTAELLDGSYTLLQRNPRTTVGVSAGLMSLVMILDVLLQLVTRDEGGTVPAWTGVTGAALQAVAELVLSGTLVLVTAEAVLGRRMGPAEALRRVRGRLPGLVALSVLVLLATVVSAVGFLVGSLIVAVLLSMATPAYVLEGTGVFQALRRSVQLVRHAWWRTFGLLFLGTLNVAIIVSVFSIPTSLIVALIGNDKDDGSLTTAQIIVGAVGSTAGAVLAAPLGAALITLLYLEQRIRREGWDFTVRGERALPRTPAAVAEAIPGPAS